MRNGDYLGLLGTKANFLYKKNIKKTAATPNGILSPECNALTVRAFEKRLFS
jgi:hypothetical protein